MTLRGQRDLRFTQIGAPVRGDLVVGPRLIDEPGDGVVSVLAVRGSEGVLALRYATAACVLERDGVSSLDEERDHAAVRGFPILPVRGAHQDGRVGSCRVRGEVQVGGESDTVPHGNHDARLFADRLGSGVPVLLEEGGGSGRRGGGRRGDGYR
ncbi:MAG: hypothetical protein IID07_09095 [Gemmatimonadetes bacterium]|nr:hypothetical protein [Gemmatimonadota bacterium]